MNEFSAQDVLQPRWNDALEARAVRLLVMAAAALAALAGVGGLVVYGLLSNDAWLRPVLGLLMVGGPLATAGALAAGVLAIRFRRTVGWALGRFALAIFLGSVVGTVGLVWGFSELFGYVDTIGEAPLTLSDFEAHLLGTEAGVAAGENADRAYSLRAYLLWPFQFDLVRDLIAIMGVLGFVSLVAMFTIWWERKVAARIQSRLGPMRVGGWHGWAQSMADGLKLIQKEDIHLDEADRPLFKLAPYLAFIPALSAILALPFGAAWVFRDLDVGLIFILAMLGIEVVSVILAGWASNNKWSVYGAMREACQMVSYEIPMGISLLVPIMTVGTLQLSEYAGHQADGFSSWLAFQTPFTFVAAVTYYVASLASCKRAPFDLPEAESELVAGFHTEYSGFRWSLFFFAEYAGMFVVSGVAVILFFGAWNSPLPVEWGGEWAEGSWWQKACHGLLFSGPLWFIGKSFFLLYVQIWLRWTLPRIRLDQVMYACVQVLIPLTMVTLLGNTFWCLWVSEESLVAVLTNFVLTAIGAVLIVGFLAIMTYGWLNRRHLVGRLAIEHLPGS